MHASPASATRGTPSRRGRSPRVSLDSPTQANLNVMQTNFSDKPQTTFTTSRSIRVEGATPIVSNTLVDSLQKPNEDSSSSSSASKRAPRKSKSDAIAALQTQARSSSPENDEMKFDSSPSDYRFSDGQILSVSPALDLTSVKTGCPRAPFEPPATRPFGLPDCPAYEPTEEEFKDPMAYIRSISDEARQYGICKILPPSNWKMPFVTDTENFRFKTRLQRLNSIEASSRARVDFLEQLYRFHQQQGNPRVVIPTINHKPLDLWLLRKEVQKLGGYEKVTKEKKWSDLGQLLGYGGIPGLSTQLKNSYVRVILPFEHYCDRVKNSQNMSPSGHESKPKVQPQKSSRLSAGATNVDTSSPPSSPLTTTSSPLSEPPDESEYGPGGERSGSSKMRRSSRLGSQEQTTPNKSSRRDRSTSAEPVIVVHDNTGIKGTPEQNCEVCHKKNRGEEMLLCDGCDCGFHIFCLEPPLTTIPKGEWFCHTCLFGTGGDFGFDEGEEHSLSSFQARDREFRKRWFESHPPPYTANKVVTPTVNQIGSVLVSESDVEHEFWRLVQSPHETVEIEYGADVHSSTHGSAMPTLEAHSEDKYAKDPWNLNNIAILSDSLLRFIKSDISGMTVPWTYVGMAFSTFCWHNEDHYTYSINFMHWGETKTWYGIPGDDAEKFEAAIKCEAPDLFEAQPDLLFQLVTLMNPKRLTDAGVRVNACNQRAGEFVITFPKAYHAGFNHGLNFNEAVNFALPDWLSYGRDCVQRYREHRKLPVFSHDELLITVTQQSQTSKTALWVADSLKEMVERELSERHQARSLGASEILEEADRSEEEQYQCAVCKVFCYLSQITCSCTKSVVCVDHADMLCSHSVSQLVLRQRFSDEYLEETLEKFVEKAAAPSVWETRLAKLLSETRFPPLRALRELLQEGERINHDLPGIDNLRRFVFQANGWAEAAAGICARRRDRKRSRKPRGRPPLDRVDEATMVVEEVADKPGKGLEDIDILLREVETLGFDCPEIYSLKEVRQTASDIQKKASTLLEIPESGQSNKEFLDKCANLLEQASSLNVHISELSTVEQIFSRQQLQKELEEISFCDMTLEDVRHLLMRARACGLQSESDRIKQLEERLSEGDGWETRAKALLAQPRIPIEHLEAACTFDFDISSKSELHDRLSAALGTAEEFERQAKAWLSSEGSRPEPQDVMKFVEKAEKEFEIQAIDDLRTTAKYALDLESRCEKVLSLQHRPEQPDHDIFRTIDEWRDYANKHLQMFTLPSFDQLEEELEAHRLWLNSIPWYCEEHQTAHGQQIFEDVVECTRPEDDVPPTDQYFTCICTSAVRPPPPGESSDAVQCDHCFARFHGVCAANGGSCPFCDHHHWNGTIHKERSWHYCFLPGILASAPPITKHYSHDWAQMEDIVQKVDRLSTVIGQFLTLASHPGNQRPDHIPQVRHYMRKLYKIQFAVSPSREVSFGLDLAGLHRILAGRPDPVRQKRRRRPRFTFAVDEDEDWKDSTRCVCRGRSDYMLGFNTIKCEHCKKAYHTGCVFFRPKSTQAERESFLCPLCCVRKGKSYEYVEVRVVPGISLLGHEQPPGVYVDTKSMIENFSKEVILKMQPPADGDVLFLDLNKFGPGQSDSLSTNKLTSRTNLNHLVSHPVVVQGVHSRSIHGSNPIPHPPSPPADFGPNIHLFQSNVPPPPWSRWGTVSTPSMPPSTQRRQPPLEISRSTPQKRKHIDDSASTLGSAHEVVASSPMVSTRPHKRLAFEHESGPWRHPPTVVTPPVIPVVNKIPNPYFVTRTGHSIRNPFVVTSSSPEPERIQPSHSSVPSGESVLSKTQPQPIQESPRLQKRPTQTLSPSLALIVSPLDEPPSPPSTKRSFKLVIPPSAR